MTARTDSSATARIPRRARAALAVLALALALAAPARAATHVSGSITVNTTWSLANSPYVIDSQTTVESGVTLTIQPGVVVKGQPGWFRYLDVRGTLNADARSAARIVFTSYADDTVAGDTNGDGAASAPVKGDWAGVCFRAGSTGTLGNVEIRYGGAYDWGAGANASLYLASSAPVVIASTFTNGSPTNMTLEGGVFPSVTNCVFSGSTGWALVAKTVDGTKNVHGNTVSGNLYNAFWIGTGLQSPTVDLTWDETAFPYAGDGISLPAGRTLTIQPGVVYKSTFGWPSRFEINGTLVAGQAAPAAKVILTDLRDDSVLGDTNGDGTASAPAGADWAGIAFRAGSGGSLTNVELRYGGAYDWGVNGASGVYINGSPALTGSTIRNSGSRGIFIDTAGTPNVGSCTLTANAAEGVRLQNAPASVHDNTITNNGSWALVAAGVNGTAALSGNTATGNLYNAINVTGTLSQNVSWRPGLPYVVDGTVTVNAGSTLTLLAGTVVKGSQNWDRFFNVSGALVAQGTAAQHVVLTSFRDDTIGGDSNGDGAASAPARGDWAGIAYRAGSTGSLAYTDVRYGGLYDYGVNGASLVYTASSGVTVDHATFSNSSLHGLYVDAGATPVITSNTFTGTSGWPIQYASPNSTAATATGNSATNCSVNGGHVFGTLAANAHWSDSLVYVIDALTINTGATLTIDPGVVVKGTNNWDRRIEVNGTLKANGTSGSPIVFTALADDTAGGDTNADGAASGPVPASWAGLAFRAGSTGNQLSYAELRYGGLYDWGVGLVTPIYLNTGSATVDHVTVKNNGGHGLAVDGGNKPTVTFNTFTGHASGWAIRLADIDSGAAQMHGNTSTGTGSGVYLGATALDGAATLAELQLPYVYDTVTIQATGNLTVNPGVVLKATNNWDRRFEINGTLNAGQAAPAAKVLFTSYFDDSALGDTNGDGTASAAAPGSWAGLAFRTGNTNCVLTNVELRYGGLYDWGVGVNAAIYVAAGAPKLAGSTVSDSSGYGIYFAGGSADVTTSRFTRNATRDLALGGSPTTPNIHGNTSIESLWYFGSGPRATFKGNTFNSWGAKQSRVSADDVAAVTDATNTFNGVTNAYLEVWSGVLATDTTWSRTAGPLVPLGYVDISGSDGPDALTTLTLAPGTTVKFPHNGTSGFRVGGGISSPPGALVADALAASRIVLTSNDAVPAPGAWQGVLVNTTGRVTLRNAFISYADTALQVSGTATLIDTLQIDRSNTGIYFLGATTPATLTNVITSNDGIGVISNGSVPVFRNGQLLGQTYGVRNDTPAQVVDARQNWWGDPTGPGPVGPGNGAKITLGVLYDSFQNAPADDGDGVPLHAGPAPNPCTCGNMSNCDDNCPLVANSSQADADCDGVGDACDTNPTLTVSSDPNDHADYARIGDAIDAAYQSGSMILVYPGLGPYVENVRADRYMQFRFVGRAGGGPVIVDGGGNPAFYLQNKVGEAPTSITNMTLRGYSGVQTSVDTELTKLSITSVPFRGVDVNSGTTTMSDSDIGTSVATGVAVASGASFTADRLTLHDLSGTGLLVGGTARVSDSLFVNGVAGADGVTTSGGSATLRYVTVANNTGYGINANAGGTVAVSDSIVYGNVGGDLRNVACTAFTRTDVGSTDCSATGSNLHADPKFTADFHLQASSPCFDRGPSPSTYAGDPPFDRAGGPRLLDWDGDGLAKTDMGAYENTNGALTPGEVTGIAWPFKTRLAWSPTPGAVRYHLYRDLVSNLRFSNYGACADGLDPNATDTQFDDSTPPARGTAYFYLVQAQDAAGHRGTLGRGTYAERSAFNPCP